MKRVLLTTTAIVGLTAPAFAADPTAVSDQPYFHHSHPMTWTGSMSIALTNLSTQILFCAYARMSLSFEVQPNTLQILRTKILVWTTSHGINLFFVRK